MSRSTEEIIQVCEFPAGLCPIERTQEFGRATRLLGTVHVYWDFSL